VRETKSCGRGVSGSAKRADRYGDQRKRAQCVSVRTEYVEGRGGARVQNSFETSLCLRHLFGGRKSSVAIAREIGPISALHGQFKSLRAAAGRSDAAVGAVVQASGTPGSKCATKRRDGPNMGPSRCAAEGIAVAH
jgi:hypothetical protein